MCVCVSGSFTCRLNPSSPAVMHKYVQCVFTVHQFTVVLSFSDHLSVVVVCLFGVVVVYLWYFAPVEVFLLSFLVCSILCGDLIDLQL